MQNLQEVFNKIKTAKKEQREIKSMYRDVLSTNEQYKQVVEKLTKLKEEKKKIEDGIKSEFRPEFDKYEELKIDIETNNQMLNDLAVNSLVKGDMIKIVDENNTEYEPLFYVRFKKA